MKKTMCLFIGLLGIAAVGVATTRTSAADGNWALPATWGGKTAVFLPRDGDEGQVGHSLFIESPQPYTQAEINIESNGKLTIQGARNGRVGTLTTEELNVAGEGDLEITAGEVTVKGILTVESGKVMISGGSLRAGKGLNLMQGTFCINGRSAKISVSTKASGDKTKIVLGENSIIEFVFDGKGVAPIDFDQKDIRFEKGSRLIVNGAGYHGPAGRFVLLNSAGNFLTGSKKETPFSEAEVVGFDGYSSVKLECDTENGSLYLSVQK